MEIKEIPWPNVLSISLALIGIILAIFFYIKGKRTKKPTYAIRSTNLIRDFKGRFGKLKIKYGDEPISNFTATKVAFWNNGKETINGSKGGDIATTDQLMIKVKNGSRFLDSDVLHPKKDDNPNQFSIKPSEDGSHVLIQFEYLDKGQGGVMQLLHTGKSSDDVEVCGTIKGYGKLKRCFGSIMKPKTFSAEWWLFVIMCFVIMPVSASTSVHFAPEQMFWPMKPTLFLKVVTVIFSLGVMGFGIYLFKRHIPKRLETFMKDFN
ncbi:MAG: hypothetical protein ACUZ77_11580 [Candidatus Brocadiales bacterium]